MSLKTVQVGSLLSRDRFSFFSSSLQNDFFRSQKSKAQNIQKYYQFPLLCSTWWTQRIQFFRYCVPHLRLYAFTIDSCKSAHDLHKIVLNELDESLFLHFWYSDTLRLQLQISLFKLSVSFNSPLQLLQVYWNEQKMHEIPLLQSYPYLCRMKKSQWVGGYANL